MIEGLAEVKEGWSMSSFNPATGIEASLIEGDHVYIKEIPNMPGHCIVFQHGQNPLIGIHIERFRILSEDET